jgi:hypothetical protein
MLTDVVGFHQQRSEAKTRYQEVIQQSEFGCNLRHYQDCKLMSIITRAITNLCLQTTEKFNISDIYANDWPIREALKLRLKYTSETARRQAQRKVHKNLKKVSYS